MFPFSLPSLETLKLIAFLVVLAAAFAAGFRTEEKFAAGKYEALVAANEKQAAEDNAKALAQLQRHNETSASTILAMKNGQLARDAEISNLRKDISHAPKTTSCVDSPAIRALRVQPGNTNDGH